MALNPLSGQPGSTVTPTVLVDPTSPANALKINSDGSINTSGGGTGGSSDVAIHDNTTTSYHLKVNADGSLNTAVVSGGGGVASSVALNDATTTANHLKINSDGSINVNPSSSSSSTALNDGTTSTQKLAIDASGKVGINNFPGSQAVTGTVAVSNLPTTQPVSGSISVSNLPATQPISGSVSVSNLTAEQAVNLNQVNGATLSAANPVFTAVQNFPSSQTVAGTVAVSNFPSTQPVSGVLNLADPTTTANKLKVNSDGSINVTGGTGGGSGSTIITDGTTTTQKLAVDASGKVGINNFPATQPVSGTIAVSNLPGTQPVSGAVNIADPTTGTQKLAVDAAGKIGVNNFPATQPVSGSVSVSNLPATQPVSGSVSVSNFPATQPVSGSVTLAAGSALAGGVNLIDSAGTNKAAVDASGNLSVKQGGALPAGTNLLGGVNVIDSAGTNKLKVNSDGSVNTAVISGGGGGSSVLATSDGLPHATVPETALGLYTSGGPVLASGLPSGLDMDRLRTVQGKGIKAVTISATSVGDTSLTCVAGTMALVMPGQALRVGATAIASEFVYVSTSYVPSTSATSIPLQSPIVTAGRTTVTFDVFSPAGPQGSAMLPTGILMQMNVVQDTNSGSIYQAPVSNADNIGGTLVPMVTAGFYDTNSFGISRHQGRNGLLDVTSGGRYATSIAAGVTSNTVVRSGNSRLMRVLVTAVGTNNMFFYDNASTLTGNIVGAIPSTATIGQVFDFQIPCTSGVIAGGNAGNPAVTVTVTY